jgi:hypothetical protein
MQDNYLILTVMLFSFLIIFAIADFIVWLYLKLKQSKHNSRLYLGKL